MSEATETSTPGAGQTTKTYDAIIVGGGHNGLCAAAYLAKAGRKVLVLERRHVLGGAAVSEEIHPGFTYSVCSYVVSLLRPWIIRDLNLAQHGLQVLPLEATFLPLPDGRSLYRGPDPAETRREIAKFSKRDADHYPTFGLAMAQLSRFAKTVIDHPAPDPTGKSWQDVRGLMRLYKGFRGLPDDLLRLQVKMLTMSAVDFLDEWFESEVLKSPMSISGIIGTFLGVRSPGTAYVLLHHYMGEIDGAYRAWGFARGGNGAVSESIANAARAFGAEIRVSAGVRKILVSEGRVTGVVLENGDELRARAVASGVDPRLTFSGLVGDEHFDAPFLDALKKFRYKGSSGKVNLALDRVPEVSCRPGLGPHLKGDITIGPSIDYLERAYDDAKYGRFSRRPFIDLTIPSLTDPTMAPPGKHVMSCFVQYAPYELAEGPDDWENQREAFGDAVVDTLSEYMPGLKDSILHRQVVTPWDLEKEFGMTEGNIFHGELSLDQLLFNRPMSGWARYRTPIKGLWLVGSGAHPGGGVMAAPGALGALQMLREGAV